jgi:YesN/AraC family two-component response regulator
MARNLTSVLIYQTGDILKDYIDFEKIHINKDEVIYRLFKNLIFQHFTKERDLQFYAGKLNITNNQLGVIIKRVSGESPRRLINTLLLNEAKRLLETTNDTIGIIAISLNYSDIHTFSKFFKRNTGHSPSHYRALSHL